MSLYIHYGSASFDPNRFDKICNIESAWTKPRGGFWASSVDADYGWRDWCLGEDWAERLGDSHFRFLITPAAKVCHLYTSEDLKPLPRRSDVPDWDDEFFIDFEQMMRDGWDAIELHLTWSNKNRGGLYWKLYGWDCDSILIMNPKVISPLIHI